MKTLMNEHVKHVKFGSGLIVNEETGIVKVEFDSQIGNKLFPFPDAFEQFLNFEDKSLQEESLLLIQAKKQWTAEENDRKHQEHERQEEERKKEELEEKKRNRKTTKATKAMEPKIKEPKVAKLTIKQ